MNLVSGYLKDVLIISVIGMLCEFSVSGYSQNSGIIEKTLKFIVSLCIFLTIIFPFFSSIKQMDFSKDLLYESKIQTHSNSGNTLIDLTKEQLEKQILQKIYSQTGINPKDICIELVVSDEKTQSNFEIKEISLILDEQHQNNAKFIKSTAESLFENTVNVKIVGEDNAN